MAYFVAFAKPGLRRVLFFVLGGALLLAGLVGCSSSSRTLWDGAKAAMFPGNPLEKAQFDPRFQYLRVDTGSNTAFMALGYLDPGSAVTGDFEEVWYSGTKEVVRLWKGRLSSTAGLSTDWRDVHFSAIPPWRSIKTTPAGVSYQRTRDTMPSYFTGIRERVTIRAIAAPASVATGVVLPSGLQWFEEVAMRADGQVSLPAARFAVDLASTPERVVYSEQCLSNTLCLALQPVELARPQSSATGSR